MNETESFVDVTNSVNFHIIVSKGTRHTTQEQTRCTTQYTVYLLIQLICITFQGLVNNVHVVNL